LARFFAIGPPTTKVYRQVVGSTNTAIDETGFSVRLERMKPKGSQPRRRIGRPPAGARAGEKVKDYPQLSIRLPGDVKAKLHALSLIAGRPQWRIITDAIDCYLRARPEPERRMVDDLAGRARAGRRR
jgi:predicted transcriptional regulator